MAVAVLTPGQTDALTRLKTLFVVCDRFSHSIRTHLGVSLGVVDDALKGIELSEIDLRDAKNALGSILGTLNAVKDLANRPAFHPRTITVSEVVDETNNSFSQSVLIVKTESRQTLETKLTVDIKLVVRALRALVQFLQNLNVRQQARNSRNVEGGNALLLSIARHEDLHVSSHLLFALYFVQDARTVGEEKLCRAQEYETISLTELADRDQSPEALGLLFAQDVFQLHGWTLTACVSDGCVLRFAAELTHDETLTPSASPDEK